MTTLIKNSNLTAEIKHFGAELISLKTNHDREYIWEGNPVFWGKHAPVLFPIVGTLKNNSFHYNAMEYHLSRHGFARDMEFELINATENSAVFSLHSSEETLKAYPFDFELQIIYTLHGHNLSIAYKVINNGKTAMPFAIGAHPAFALPNQFESYAIAFEKEEPLKYYLLEDDLISNKTKKLDVLNKYIPLTYELFENDALIFKTLKSNSLTILENKNPILKIHFDDFPSLGIWTKINAAFICIEPWFGYSDTNESSENLFEKEGIQILETKETFQSKYSIEIL
ncbi:aldose 1-epimerase family protein [Flavobacterium sp. GSP27]|uniref:aldose 1-epimerase family protein n=1 Tax=unclassified Flavobacterium TaxID=196869 RepID=UPI000F8195C5|nr:MULTISPECIES: aldose 1-epimerase family protein [unclassified Flavobacterium]RTY94541.1 aldose 1-epimerase family protein [Flavobacterium sp. GSN2]RTY66720.1 aldose 1-epimerase family protein [Flavobacterium sp. LB2P53]RTY82500.1 aldose 1-epimerase family protein [Flavobacterium sp. LS1P28]RTY84893.1 aldose 1-epimerase family protein [Flavobacterium sp. ZB4P23]RTY90714.1 aldose 1-epimerase family protein [Flavobacterium sp. RSP46]